MSAALSLSRKDELCSDNKRETPLFPFDRFTSGDTLWVSWVGEHLN